MDAALAFIARENGNIEIAFDDDAVGADFRQFRIIVSLPDVFAVQIDTADDLLIHVAPSTPRSLADTEPYVGDSDSLVA